MSYCRFQPLHAGGDISDRNGTRTHLIEDAVSGATLTLSRGVMTITMPMEFQSDNYHQPEELLMHMVCEALQVIHQERWNVDHKPATHAVPEIIMPHPAEHTTAAVVEEKAS